MDHRMVRSIKGQAPQAVADLLLKVRQSIIDRGHEFEPRLVHGTLGSESPLRNGPERFHR